MTVKPGLGTPGGVVTATDHRRGLSVTSAPGSSTDPLVTRSGIVNAPGNPLKVSQNSPLGMSVLVQAGGSEIHRAGKGIYRPWNDAVATVPHDVAPGSNSRWDLVYIAQNDAEAGDANNLPALTVAKGTVLASPAKPYDLIPAGGLVLAEVGPIVPSTVAITDAMITNVAPFVGVRGAPWPVRTQAERDALTSLASAAFPITVERLDTGALERNTGSGWKTLSMPAVGTFTPVLSSSGTAPTLGTGGVIAGRFVFDGPKLDWQIDVTFGAGATAGSGVYLLSLPTSIAGAGMVGAGYIYAGTFNDVVCQAQSATTFRVLRGGATLDYWGSTWLPLASGNVISLRGSCFI